MPDDEEGENMSVVESVAAGVAIIEGVRRLLSGTSAVIEVDNNAPFPLRRVAVDHDHGGFAKLPLDVIAPNSVDVFGSQADAGSIGTGTTGSVSYVGDGLEMLIGWIVPFSGENETNVGPTTGFGGKPFGRGLGGTNASRFLVIHEAGNGSDKVHIRFRLVRHAPYSLRQSLKDLGVSLRDEGDLVNKGLRTLFPGTTRVRDILPNTTQRKL